MKVLFYNNYDMRQAWHNWKERLAPDQHLFGVNYLEQNGIQVRLLRHKSGFIREASKYGNLNQQTRVALQGFLYSVVYCGYFEDACFLARLRDYHVFKTDLLSKLDHPLERNEFYRQTIKAHWRITVLSKKLYDESISVWPEFKDKFTYIPWGADLRFYPEASFDSRPEGYILSIGSTRRDFKTLVEAARKNDRQFVICTSDESGLERGDLPKNVVLHEKSYMSYAETLRLYRNSLAVAIPLNTPGNYRGTQIGLSSLVEAMAMGKPVIMTHHPLIDIDIQQEGIGYWTRSKDANSWIEAVNKVSSDPKCAMEMGQRGRRLCEEKYNTERYGKDLCRLLSDHPAFESQPKRNT